MADALCVKCGGTVVTEQDIDDGYVRTCLACGKLQPYDGDEAPFPLDRAKQPRALAQITKPDWVTTAVDDVRAIAAAYEKLRSKMQHAEQTIAALRAYGYADLPILPWKMRKLTAAEIAVSPSNRGRRYCAKCQRTLGRGESRRIEHEGHRDYFCKDGCPAVAKTA